MFHLITSWKAESAGKCFYIQCFSLEMPTMILAECYIVSTLVLVLYLDL